MFGSLKPKHTVASVAKKLADGLRDGSIVLNPPVIQEPVRSVFYYWQGSVSRHSKAKPAFATAAAVKTLPTRKVNLTFHSAGLLIKPSQLTNYYRRMQRATV